MVRLILNQYSDYLYFCVNKPCALYEMRAAHKFRGSKKKIGWKNILGLVFDYGANRPENKPLRKQTFIGRL